LHDHRPATPELGFSAAWRVELPQLTPVIPQFVAHRWQRLAAATHP